MIISIILIFVLSLLAELLFPWWSIAVAAFLVGFWSPAVGLRGSGWKAMAAGFLGVGFLWLATAGWHHIASGGILTSRVGEMFGISAPVVVVFVTASLGGLVGGLAASTGYHLRHLFKTSN